MSPTRAGPRHERRPAARRACSAPGRSGARSSARSSTRPDELRPSDGAAPRARRRRRPRRRPRACRRACPPTLLTDAPGPPRRRRRHRRHRRADGRRRAGPHAHRRRPVDGQGASSPPTSTSSPITGRSSRRSPAGPARRSASRPRSAAASRSSARSPSDLAANRIERVRGHRQRHDELHPDRDDRRGEPLDYAAALAEAQRLGYAEADPSGDVEGLDAVNKLVILARLAFDRWLDPAAIATRPRRRRRPGRPRHHDGEPGRPGGRARAAGRIIRLARDGVGRRRRRPVAPRSCRPALPRDSALGRTAGVRNRIEVDAEPVGRVGFDGPGAGGAATSSAVLGDLIAIARGAGSTWGPGRRRPARRDERSRARPAMSSRRERRPVPDR